ncbi:MAG: hypothetical protein Q4E12_08185 [Coriobacteriia bacterium]|nr:hypothetical protein [Coriobacteriia bacterium]
MAILTTRMLVEQLGNYSNPKSKIARMVKAGQLTPVAHGVYETDSNVPGYCLAAIIYGPSYLSFEYALARHGLIPEAVRAYTCATTQKKKSKLYETPFGTYTYKDVPIKAFVHEVAYYQENGYAYYLASPEKALCDQLFHSTPAANQKELQALLFEDLRIDPQDLRNLNAATIEELSQLYRCRNIHKLAAIMRRR